MGFEHVRTWRCPVACLLFLLSILSSGLVSCHSPPFSAPQPLADWSDPSKQSRASVEAVECTGVVRYGPRSGCWVVRVRARVTASTRQAAVELSFALTQYFFDVAPWTATLRGADGAQIRLLEPVQPWITIRDGAIPCVTFAQPETPRQLPSGEWEQFLPIAVLAASAPVGTIEFAIDGEALRKNLIRVHAGGWKLTECPPGGLTGTVSVLPVPSRPPAACEVIPIDRSIGHRISRANHAPSPRRRRRLTRGNCRFDSALAAIDARHAWWRRDELHRDDARDGARPPLTDIVEGCRSNRINRAIARDCVPERAVLTVESRRRLASTYEEELASRGVRLIGARQGRRRSCGLLLVLCAHVRCIWH